MVSGDSLEVHMITRRRFPTIPTIIGALVLIAVLSFFVLYSIIHIIGALLVLYAVWHLTKYTFQYIRTTTFSLLGINLFVFGWILHPRLGTLPGLSMKILGFIIWIGAIVWTHQLNAKRDSAKQ